MSGLFRENVFETSTTAGTIDFVLAGAVTGALTFDGGFGTGEKWVAYKIRNAVRDGEFEVGICPQDGTALRRTDGIVLSSSNSNALVNWGSAAKNVWCELPATFGNDFDKLRNVGTFGGTANALTFSPPAPIPEWIDGLVLIGRATNTNTSAAMAESTATGLAAKAIELRAAALVGGEIVDDNEIMLIYRLSTDKLQLVQLENERVPVVARSTNTELAASDHKRGFVATSTFTQTLDEAAVLGNGWWVDYRNDGTGVITLDPSGSELIDGATTLALQPGQSCLIRCTGTAFKTYGLSTGGGSPGARVNLRGVVTSATQLDIDADYLSLVDASGLVKTVAAVNLTVDITASGANGLDTGTEASDTWYHGWVISDGSTTAGLFSTSATAPTLPANYTFKLRVCAVRNDGSSNFFRAIYRDRKAQYLVGTNPSIVRFMATGSAGTPDTPTWSAVAVGAFVPPTAVSIQGAVHMASSSRIQVAPNASYGALTGGAGTNISFAGHTGNNQAMPFDMILESTDIYWASASGGGNLACFGWEDGL